MSEKTLDVESQEDAQQKISDVQVYGNTNMWQLISKASSKEQGWMKSTKALEIPNLGVVIQVSTQQGDNVAEALIFVPGAVVKHAKIDDDPKKVDLTLKEIVADPELF